LKDFKTYRQLDQMDCGPTCIRMVAQYYGKHFSLETLRNKAQYSKEGVSLLGISDAAESIGFRTRGVKLSYEELIKDVTKPCILHWDQNHFVVLAPLLRRGVGVRSNEKIPIADPAKGQIVEYTKKEFLAHWLSTKENQEENLGIALLLEPTPDFYKQTGEKKSGIGWGYLLQYVWQQNNIKKEMLELENKIMEEKKIFTQALYTYYNTIEDWKQKYLLLAPVSGKVNFASFINENQLMQIGKPNCYITNASDQFSAEIVIAPTNIIKVKPGMEINLKFQSYPYQEFGTVKGIVQEIKAMPLDSGFVAKITLPNMLTTNRNKQIAFSYGLTANGEIITDNKRLLQKILNGLLKK
jgi:hypothetical protein